MAKGTVLTLSDLYADSSLYTNVEASVPPAELKDNVIVFEAETGCNHGRCTYCMIYDGVRYSQKSLSHFNTAVDRVWKRVDPSLAMDFTRQFVAGGNVLGFETAKLERMVEHLERRFYENTDRYPERTALYGRTDSILMQGKEGLGRINCGNLGYGVNLIFWGLESGSTNVLDYVRKGYTQEDILRAAEIINSSPVEVSVMVMPGLGGARYYEEHLRETAKVLGIIKPKFITFMGLNAHPDSLYARIMAEEQRLGMNRNLKDDEKAMQMIQMIEEMPGFETTIGCFSNEIDKVGHNPLEFRGNTSEKIKDNADKRDVVINSMCDFSIRWDARFDSTNPEFTHLAHLQPLLEVSV